jgi:hypothetical protein
MQTPREESIVRMILKYINSLPRCYAEKTHGSAYTAGRADITACVGGRRVELEVKRPGKRATPLQQRFLDRWERSGAVVGTVHSVTEVKELFTAHHMIH